MLKAHFLREDGRIGYVFTQLLRSPNISWFLNILCFNSFGKSWGKLYRKCIIVGNKVKGRVSKRVFQENKARQIFRKTNISYPLIRTRTCAYQGVRNVPFSENLTCFVFLKHPFWGSPSCLITDVILDNKSWFICGESNLYGNTGNGQNGMTSIAGKIFICTVCP